MNCFINNAFSETLLQKGDRKKNRTWEPIVSLHE